MSAVRNCDPYRVVLRTDPEYRAAEDGMDFRLTYEGPLRAASNSGSKRPKEKHEIRKVFHKQLKRLWKIHPYLKEAQLSDRRRPPPEPRVPLVEHLAHQYERMGYNFVPLVTEELRLICGLDILFIRNSVPGEIVNSAGDLDNRIKTLLDALRMPTNQMELGGYTPNDDETPFFCLLSDDKLITHLSIETDMLLQPTSPKADQNDVRLVIAVRLRPFDVGWDNISFG